MLRKSRASHFPHRVAQQPCEMWVVISMLELAKLGLKGLQLPAIARRGAG